MGKFGIKYMVMRKGRYYWMPKARYKEGGFVCTPLGDDFNKAIAKAGKLNAELVEWRKGVIPNKLVENTISWLAQKYMLDNRFARLTERTKDEYIRQIQLLEKWAKNTPVNSISRSEVKELYLAFAATKKRKAEEIIKVGKLLFNFGKDMELVTNNPFEKQSIDKNEPRRLIWTSEQVAAVVNAARLGGQSSIALAVMLAVETGQRQGDILNLHWSQYDGESIILRQGKTGTEVCIPCTTDLKNQLALTDIKEGTIVVCEATNKPYKSGKFQKDFRAIANKVGISQELQFKDFRRTAAVRLAEAGCSALEVSAITGHLINTDAKILEVYAPRSKQMAVNAINKLEAFKVIKVGTEGAESKKRLELNIVQSKG